MKRNGFTFVELLLAVVIAAFVTITAAAAMRGIAAGRQRHEDLTVLSDAMRYACDAVRTDLSNLYRNGDYRKARFVVDWRDPTDGVSSQTLNFYTVSGIHARPDQPEGDVYEVEYFITVDPDTQRSILMRRYCPTVPGVKVDESLAAQGMLFPLAQYITTMTIRCYDGSEWQDHWDDQSGRFPILAEVAFRAVLPDSNRSVVRSVVVHFPRLPSGTGDTSSDDSGDYDAYMNSDFSDTPQASDAQEDTWHQ